VCVCGYLCLWVCERSGEYNYEPLEGAEYELVLKNMFVSDEQRKGASE